MCLCGVFFLYRRVDYSHAQTTAQQSVLEQVVVQHFCKDAIICLKLSLLWERSIIVT